VKSGGTLLPFFLFRFEPIGIFHYRRRYLVTSSILWILFSSAILVFFK